MSRQVARGQPADGLGQYPSGSANSTATATTSASASATSSTGIGTDGNAPPAWWWSPQAETIKYAAVGGIIVFVLILLLMASLHAQRRLRDGKQPLAYHRWLVRRRMQEAQVPAYPRRGPAYFNQQDGYAMETYIPPPPAYHVEHENVPAYAPPSKDSKVQVQNTNVEVPNAGGPSQPPAAADPSRPMYS